MHFGFLMYPGYEELDLVGPWEMVGLWNTYANGPKCVSIAESEGPMRCAKGLTTIPDVTFSNAPPLDYLLIPGGFAVFDAIKSPALVEFVRSTSRSAKAVLSVCTGTFILHAAGLLDGKKCATNWKFVKQLRADGVDVREERYVADGTIWSSAGVSAGIDMILALIQEAADEESAAITQLSAEYFPEGKIYGTPQSHPIAPEYIKRLVP